MVVTHTRHNRGSFSMTKSKFLQWLGVVISLGAILILVRSLHLERVVQSLAEADYWWLIPAVSISLLSFIPRAQRFRIYLLPLGWFSLWRSYGYIAINYMGNNVLPARAGEALLSYIVYKVESIPISSSLAVNILGRVVDGLWLLLLLVAGIFFLPFPGWIDQLLVIGLAVFGAVFLGFMWLVFGSADHQSQLHTVVAKLLPKTLDKFLATVVIQIKHAQNGLQALKDPSAVGQGIILTAIIWLCEGLVYYFVGQALQIELSLWYWILILAITNIASSIPSGPAGIGTFEGIVIITLGLAGVDANQAAAYALLLHVTQVLPITLVGLMAYGRLMFGQTQPASA